MRKYDADFEHCPQCGFLRAHNPHWLEEAYSSAIADADTGLIRRNISIAAKVAGILYFVVDTKQSQNIYLDAAGGYGTLTRMMRDIGFNFFWSDKYCENILAKGFEYQREMGNCYAVTAMEVMEHLVDPVSFVEEAIASVNADLFIFTTELYSGGPPQPDKWWYYAFPTGQHIGFFQQRTLEAIAHRLGLYVISANGIHAFSRQPLSWWKFAFATHPIWSRILVPFISRSIGSLTTPDHQKLIGTI
ncbi:class I SAM-dependent methyltransferase [Limnobacter humi]|uniref:Class I SAM-dependent methyltransferase n=1 Tax=Limnobacter humi TaxID=1778671 RepID=A0ABT1WJP5_9BURK|nr:class I SAM-dependent methyltransferase [Limnobacter humi]MCQ8897736.1 class I SAM-dependent methyltransferase [Limnobacter humi]